MENIVDVALKWLTNGGNEHNKAPVADQHIVESLLNEIKRLETANARMAEEMKRFRTERESEIKLATAEECAVICETADYVTRNYGCAREIRKKFGLDDR